MATSFVYSWILVRFCGLGLSGVWSYLFAVACTLGTLAAFGGRTYQVTDASDEIRTCTYIRARRLTVCAAFLVLLVFAAVKGFSPRRTAVLLLVCVFKFFDEISDVYYGVLQKHGKLYLVGQSLFFKSLLNMLLFFLGAVLSKDLLWPAALLFLNNLLFILLVDKRQALRCEQIVLVPDRAGFVRYFRSHLLICLCLFLATFLANCPKYVLERFMSEDMQGIYNALSSPATAVTLAGSFLINPILVELSQLYRQNRIAEMQKTSGKIAGILLLLGAAGCLGGYWLGVPLLNLIYHTELSAYRPELVILIAGCTFFTVSTVQSTILISARRLRGQLAVSLLLGALSPAVYVPAVQRYGIRGAACGYCLVMLLRFAGYSALIGGIKRKPDSTPPLK